MAKRAQKREQTDPYGARVTSKLLGRTLQTAASLARSVWLAAVEEADLFAFSPFAEKGRRRVGAAERRHLLPLIGLLVQEPISEEGIALISDLLARHQPLQFQLPGERWSMEEQRKLAYCLLRNGLKAPRGKPTTPIYARSLRDAQIECAIAEYRAFREVGLRVDLGEIAKLHGLSESTLANALNVSRGSDRRKAARRAALFKGGSKA